ncbi:hypothetical protein WME98_44640 [Sorangium sp. So ce296]|uniref:Uncharacterized protein n=2 Tax=Sorangium cellulosum TaxID=56 RepID=A0A150QEH5_SORCE|nr:hypothetical protein [Sorangium cellulosum]AGP36637.1 hypothetical protein SCE1572_20340 [Sorangium cellulosum So0157-2]KYF66385.1 hypothetical protein BE04_04435 [Sorangium cellulosum]
MEHSIFAMEVCARMDPGSVLQRTLHECVQGHCETMSLNQKWHQYRRAQMALLSNLHVLEKGCWDYFDDNARALNDFSMWSRGMTTEEGARRGPSGTPDPYRGQPRYLTFTMAFLLVQGSPTDRMLCAVCDIPKDRLWRRDVFGHILQNLGHVSFASVKSDVIYLIPRDEGWALTAEDLNDPKFHYLRKIV